MVRHLKRDDESYEMRHDFAERDDEYDHSVSSFEDDTTRAYLLTDEQPAYPSRPSILQKIFRLFSSRPSKRSARTAPSARFSNALKPHGLRRLCFISLATLTALLLVTAIFFPSYSNPPLRYAVLRDLAETSDDAGAGNPRHEKVFIAASVFDKAGDLASGHWGINILRLVDLLGPEHVYLSIYENDAGEKGQHALQELEKKVKCPHSLAFEEHLSLDEVPHITLPDGTDRVKRIEYLAEVRNRALRPLGASATRFDKVLYLNDVIFDPIEAAQLLFMTNADDKGRAEYRAACAVDFINPFKYYDTFATRDMEGYGIGLPFFPWFTTSGHGISRQEVLSGRDNVRVKSCWGGMVAFDARYLQPQSNPMNVPFTAAGESSSNISAPYSFRAEQDLYWDASECCLIHADIQDPDPEYSGIFLNPYIRVAYDSRTLSWLSFTRKFERLYSPIHWLVTKSIGMPWNNPRRAEKPNERVLETVWVPDEKSPEGGSFQKVERLASHSGFCGRRALQVLKNDIREGEKNWEFLPVPG